MTIRGIMTHCDHTALKQTTTWADIEKLSKEAIEYNTASICIPPCYVKRAKEHFGDELKICTVIGFPNGNTDTDTKVFEASKAIENGADEIDMVINIGMLKAYDYDGVKNEIKKLSCLCHDLRPDDKQIVLKVIIETCLLTDDEIAIMCKLCAEAKADYIKTSTGFSTTGATKHNVKLMAETIKKNGYNLKIKAAGGIKNISDAKDYIKLGADRLGTSSLVEVAAFAKETLGENW